MSAAVPGPTARERVLDLGRLVLAVVIAGGVSAIVFLVIVQEAYVKGWTEHQFNAVMGVAAGADTPDDIKHQGFYATLAVFMLLAVLHGALVRRLPWRWWWQGLVTGGVILLGWGAVLGPYVQGRSDIPAGLFAHEASWQTVPLFVVASLATGQVLSRVYDLVRSASWWEPKHFDLRESLDSLFTEEVEPGTGPPQGDAPAQGRRGVGPG